jgi:selenocysteine lyase/cysteine desulfurase
VTVDDVEWAGPPDRDEAGSPNVVGAVALAQAIISLQAMGMDALARHEAELTAHALRRLQAIDGVEVYGLTDPERAGERVGVIPFNLAGVDHYKIAAILSFEGGIGVRNGCFCAHPYILRLLQVDDDDALRHRQDILDGQRVGLPGLVRISFGCYNTIEEIDHTADVLARIAAGNEEGEYEQDPASGAYWPRGYEPDYETYFTLQPGLKPQPRRPGMPRCGV